MKLAASRSVREEKRFSVRASAYLPKRGNVLPNNALQRNGRRVVALCALELCARPRAESALCRSAELGR